MVSPPRIFSSSFSCNQPKKSGTRGLPVGRYKEMFGICPQSLPILGRAHRGFRGLNCLRFNCRLGQFQLHLGRLLDYRQGFLQCHLQVGPFSVTRGNIQYLVGANCHTRQFFRLPFQVKTNPSLENSTTCVLRIVNNPTPCRLFRKKQQPALQHRFSLLPQFHLHRVQLG
jgi:hypothetical protein